MGNNCNSKTVTTTKNLCNDLGDEESEKVVQNFCGSQANSSFNWCDKIGSPGEWINDDYIIKSDDDLRKFGCVSNSCDGHSAFSFGQCDNCYGVDGVKIRCKRAKFLGDPFVCCFNDLEFNGSEKLCWSDSNQKNTCDPANRSLISDNCQKIMIDYFTGIKPKVNDISWVYKWMDPSGKPLGSSSGNSIIRVISRNLFTEKVYVEAYESFVYSGYEGPFNLCQGQSPKKCANVSESGKAYVINLIAATIKRYQSDGFKLGAFPGKKGYHPFQEFLRNYIISPLPYIFQQALKDACGGYVSSDLIDNPELINWCGCYLPETEYSKYKNSYGVNRECTPLCNRPTAIPIVDVNNLPILCNSTLCIIDDLTISLIDTTVKGDININQMCGNCAGPGNGNRVNCSCRIENNTINTLNSSFNGNINITQSCSDKPVCQYRDSSGKLTLIDCDSSDAAKNKTIAEQQAETEREAKIKTSLIIVIIIVALILVTIIILAVVKLIFKRGKTSKLAGASE